MTVHILLPAFNEEEAIPRVLDRIAGAAPSWNCDWRVLLVDDGSTDATVDRARRSPVGDALWVHSHFTNLGLAAALRSGIKQVCAEAGEDDVLVTMDADDTHDPALVGPMLERLRAGADIVVASRFRPGGGGRGIPPYRQLLSWGARLFLRILFPMTGVTEYTCCFRAMRVTLYRRALQHYGEGFIRSNTFAAAPEILLRMRRFGPRVEEVPLLVRYDRKAGPSKIHVGRTVIGYLRLAWLMRNPGDE